MNKHLTEQQLIDYQFKLASDGGRERGPHAPGAVRGLPPAAAELARKFAALDLLRDEVKASEDLLSRDGRERQHRLGRWQSDLAVPGPGAGRGRGGGHRRDCAAAGVRIAGRKDAPTARATACPGQAAAPTLADASGQGRPTEADRRARLGKAELARPSKSLPSTRQADGDADGPLAGWGLPHRNLVGGWQRQGRRPRLVVCP